MDAQIDLQSTYTQQVQQHLQFIEQSGNQCKQQIEQLKLEAEAKLNNLPPGSEEEEIKIKIDLQEKLNQLVEQHLQILNQQSSTNLKNLESINKQQEAKFLHEIEAEFTKI